MYYGMERGVTNYNNHVTTPVNPDLITTVKQLKNPLDKFTEHRASEFTGKGETIVIIDTGMGAAFKNENVIHTVDFAGSNTDGVWGAAHGTAVAQTALSIAKDANIIHLKVFGDSGGSTSASKIVEALSWVVKNGEDYNVTAVNISIASNSHNVTHNVSGNATDRYYAELESMGISTTVAAGNIGGLNAVNIHAASDHAIAVSGSNDGKMLAQKHEDVTDIFAFWGFFGFEKNNGKTSTVAGTSIAAPRVAGMIALLQDTAKDLLGKTLHPDLALKILQESGDGLLRSNGKNYNGDADGYAIANKLNAVKLLIDYIYNDDIKGTENNDKLHGGAGDDIIDGKAGDDTLRGGKGDDTIHGSDGNDKIYGNDGKDTLHGGNGNDELRGGNGSDVIHAGNGNDIARGGEGSDKIWGNGGNDELRGGKGNDMLSGGDGNDELYGGKGNDSLSGGNGDDVIKGRDGKDALYGGEGDDFLSGGDGHDHLYGGKGNDILKAGSGYDQLYGGTGADTFLFTNTSGFTGGKDNQFNRIFTFNEKEDVIDISRVLDTYLDPLTDLLDDFVSLVDNGKHTTIRIDTDGSGATAQMKAVAIIDGYTGHGNDFNDMIDSGQLII